MTFKVMVTKLVYVVSLYFYLQDVCYRLTVHVTILSMAP